MRYFSKSNGVDWEVNMKEFSNRYGCHKWLEATGFISYLPLSRAENLYRKVEGTTTQFAKIQYNTTSGTFNPVFSTWPKKRIIVKLTHDKYRKSTVELLEWLKEHDKGSANHAGGIIEPVIFSSTVSLDNQITERVFIFSFLDPSFAIEFKLIWG